MVSLVLLSRLLFGSTIEEARNLENAGRKSEAIVVFGRWLADNGHHPDAVAVLIHASSLFEDPLETVSFLSKYVHLLPGDKRGEIFVRMAGLETSLGLLGFAVQHYELALQHSEVQNESWRLQYLQLKHSIGENIRMEALELKKTARNRVLIAESGLLAAMAHSDIRQGIAEIQDLIENNFIVPSTWLYLAKLQARIGDDEGVEESLRNLE
ncbi:MAG: hypothetical protein B0D92_00525, partial [Spirochaeta sp. LUC14_002_19_P3]